MKPTSAKGSPEGAAAKIGKTAGQHGNPGTANVENDEHPEGSNKRIKLKKSTERETPSGAAVAAGA